MLNARRFHVELVIILLCINIRLHVLKLLVYKSITCVSRILFSDYSTLYAATKRIKH